MKNVRYLFPIFVVFIWFTHYDTHNRPHTEIDVWQEGEGATVTAEILSGTLSVTPWKMRSGYPFSHMVTGITYHDVCWTVIDDANGSAVYMNHLKDMYSKIAPVDDVVLKNFEDR
jgi:hypothetical protein